MNTAVGRLSLLQGNLPDPGIELGSSAIQVDSLPADLPGKLHLLVTGREAQMGGTRMVPRFMT